MKKDGICGRVFGWVVPAAVAVCAVPCGAEMLYYLPFDDGVSATLVDYGSAGGAATAERMTEWGGAPAPTNSTETVAPNLGGTHALKCTRQGTNGGLLAMPDSTNRFRLTDTSGRMTVCTWIYWKGYYESGIANAMPTTDNQGWSWRIGASGEFKMLYKTATSGGTRTTGAGTIPSNVWLHVAMRWDCSSNYALQWFVNGIATNASLTYTGSGVLNTSTQDVAVANANQSPLGGGVSLPERVYGRLRHLGHPSFRRQDPRPGRRAWGVAGVQRRHSEPVVLPVRCGRGDGGDHQRHGCADVAVRFGAHGARAGGRLG